MVAMLERRIRPGGSHARLQNPRWVWFSPRKSRLLRLSPNTETRFAVGVASGFLDVSASHRRSARRLVRLAERNRGVYVKLAQHAASMHYLLPPEYTDQLQSLQQAAPATPFEEVSAILREELGVGDLSLVFSQIDSEPVGAGGKLETALSLDFDAKRTSFFRSSASPDFCLVLSCSLSRPSPLRRSEEWGGGGCQSPAPRRQGARRG